MCRDVDLCCPLSGYVLTSACTHPNAFSVFQAMYCIMPPSSPKTDEKIALSDINFLPCSRGAGVEKTRHPESFDQHAEAPECVTTAIAEVPKSAGK